MDVLHDPEPFGRGADLRQGRELGVREYVLLDPRVRGHRGAVVADRMEQEQSVRPQQLARFCQIRAVVAHTHVFEHSERVDGVKAADQASVVLQTKVCVQSCAALAGGLQLVSRNGYAGDRGSIPLCHELRRATPTATDVQHAHSWPRSDLARDQIELRLLRLVQASRGLKIGAAVDHARVEHELVQIVAKIVMPLADDIGAAGVLQVEEAGAQCQLHRTWRPQILLDVAAENARKHLIELVAVPPAVHVGLAGSQRSVAEDTMKQPLVVYAHVPRTRSIETHVCGR